MKCKTIFVTGTDTDVGKSFICALMLRFLHKQGVDVGYQKWVSTGSATDPIDLDYCMKALNRKVSTAELDLLVPFRFSYPASPHLAAELDGKKVDPKVITDQYRKISKTYELLVVEGAGGLLVPLCRDLLLIDFLARFNLPTLIVARSGLGTINHTMLSLEALRARKIPIMGVVFSDASESEDETIVQDNMRTIAEMANVTVFGRMSRIFDKPKADTAFKAIGQAIFQTPF